MLGPILTSQEVADMLKIDEQTVVRLAQRGELPAIKIARRWRFSTAALEALFRPGQSPKENQGESSS